MCKQAVITAIPLELFEEAFVFAFAMENCGIEEPLLQNLRFVPGGNRWL